MSLFLIASNAPAPFASRATTPGMTKKRDLPKPLPFFIAFFDLAATPKAPVCPALHRLLASFCDFLRLCFFCEAADPAARASASLFAWTTACKTEMQAFLLFSA